MKKSIVVLIMVVVLIGGLVFIRGPAQRTIGTWRKLEQGLDMVERVVKILEVSPAELNRMLKEQGDELREEVQQKDKIISEQQAIIARQAKKLAEIPEYEVPEISYVEPEDFQNCLQELDRSRQVSEQLLEVVEYQKTEIALLRSINTSKGVIIQSQAEIIEKQSSYIEQFEGLLKEHSRRTNRRIAIAAGLTIIVAFLL